MAMETNDGYEQELPQYVVEDIVNRVEDARDVAIAQCVCKDWRDAADNVRSLRIIVLNEYHEKARDNSMDATSIRPGIRDNSSALGSSGKALVSDEAGPSTLGSTAGPSTLGSTAGPSMLGSTAGPSTSNSTAGSSKSSSIPMGRLQMPFKEQVVKILERKCNIIQLRIEVEPKLQSKTVPEGERRLTDHWFTDPWFLKQILPNLGSTLQHLCIVDYGQQAIMRRSNIIKLLSISCKLLKTLDLRNMFIDTTGCEEMNLMASLTLRCVKVVSETLQHINDKMSNLQTLALLGVFGADGGKLTFKDMKVLCLGLSTLARELEMDLPKLEKLQLKMQCPTKLIIDARILKYVAFNLEVLDQSKVDLRSMVGLEELLYGATSFITLSNLVVKNLFCLKKIFLDIPCMALGDDGRFLGVLKDISLHLPSFSKLNQCEKLSVLNIGPGLWYSMETQLLALSAEERWPSMTTLIVHMIPHDMESAIMVLGMLLRPSVTSLTVFIHTSSPVTRELMIPRIEEIATRYNIVPQILTWTKSLDFSCFSF